MLKSLIKEDDAKHGDDPHLERIGCGVEVDVLEACHAGFVRTYYMIPQKIPRLELQGMTVCIYAFPE
jgi:hypothetical protein